MAFTIERLHKRLTALTPDKGGRYLLAYSGGCDSQVLLHALAALGGHLNSPVVAIHVNHGLQDDAEQWARHCAASCSALDIPLETVSLALQPAPGESVEAVAREGRYRAIRELMQPGDLLLTAHQQDDQAETLLLQLFRGAGLRGMAAMPEVAPFGPGHLLRPLLGFTREQLESYATEHRLSWIEDTSNLDQRFDRNYLRHSVMPLLLERWPSIRQTLSRSATYCAEAQGEIERVARDDLSLLLAGDEDALSVSGLLALDPARLRSVLRLWIREHGFRAPNSRRMQQIVSEVLGAGEDRNPVVGWEGVQVRRYRGYLYLVPEAAAPDPNMQLAWDGTAALELPEGIGRLVKRNTQGGIDEGRWHQGDLTVRFRQQGLSCRPVGRGGSVSLKKLFQELGVPPWERGRVPLLFIDGQLAAVGSMVVCEPFQAKENQPGLMPEIGKYH
ncbi:MAG: tRNA lysidine(34) synthetase TilS [Sedimenticola sp.]